MRTVIWILCFLVAAGMLVSVGQPAQQAAPTPITTGGRLTHVSTDRPIYRTGEKVYVRGVLLDATTHRPGRDGATGAANFEILGPKGETVTSGLASVVDSVAGFYWDIPQNQVGGEYTVRIFHSVTGDAPGERKFDIRAYRAPRLKGQIVFLRDGYGPGDTVTATLHVDRAEGGIPRGAGVSVIARVNGEDVWQGEAVVDAAGNARARFRLPAGIERGEGTLAMTIADGGTVETVAKTIPILLQTLDLAIYPEGGDLVAGLENRVYLEGRTPAGKPADIAGIVLDASGRRVTAFRTQHEGRGRFSFVPAKGESYTLRVTQPSGIRKAFPLPAVKDSGVVLASTSDVTPRREEIVVRAAATASGSYGFALSQRGNEIAFRSVDLDRDQPVDVAFTVPRSVDGVLVVTVYDEQDTPMAERLLFRQPEHKLNVQVLADRYDYVPGDEVTLRVLATDETGEPVEALVGLTVTDSSVLEMIDKREQAPRLPVMVLLENDVRSLSDAHVYLDDTNPDAPVAVDLLLGTQGWRRFATLDVAKFLSDHGDAARRALAIQTVTEAERAQFAANENAFFELFDGFAAVRGGRVDIPAAALDNAPRPQLGQPFAKVAPAAEPVARDAIGGMEFREADFEVMGFIAIREYAHTLREGWTAGNREDFTETVYWNAGVKTDADGTATVSFHLSDAVTAFRVLADGFGSDGALGSGVSEIESVRPFYVETKIPLQVTGGDVIQVPVTLVNGRHTALGEATVTAAPITGMTFSWIGDTDAGLGGRERARRLLEITVARDFHGSADLTLDATAGGYRDTVTRTIDVQPLGFPHEATSSGELEPDGSTSFEFTLPAGMVPGSASSSVRVYPTPLANLTEALESLLREPNGCFEQTSSTSYPLVMAQQYFLTHTGIDPGLIEKAQALLESSYKRLTGFESKSRGYEWFGADPGHEALTAYGLLQFTDMARVRRVDEEMMERTRDWLLQRRDGSGGFGRNERALDSFGRAPEETTNAYITWALIESGERGLEKEIASVERAANATTDSYVIALAANTLHATGNAAGARTLLDKLAKAQGPDGRVNGSVTSITQSGGEALAIETTALSVLAWMREPGYSSQVQEGLGWILESNRDGRFGSTQSTILALRAIVAYDAAHARPKAAGRLRLIVDGTPIGAPVAFDAESQGALVLPEFAGRLRPGRHTVVLEMEGGSSMPFSISVKHHSLLPETSDRADVGLRVRLEDEQVREGALTEAVVSVAGKSDDGIPTPVAIIGIPGGLEVRHDQLKELVESGKIDAYEVKGREVVLYWRALEANAAFDLPLSLVASIPGTFTAPSSRAYRYYTDEFKAWSPGLSVTVLPR